LLSDAASVLPLTQALFELPGLRFMRDPTRGGLATVAHELCRGTGLRINLDQSAIPLRDPVVSVCDMLGYDPLYLACEGRVVAVVSADQADQALQRWRMLPGGEQAEIIGETERNDPYVVLRTELGGSRILDELEDDPLPRIC
jgi:hydrogenase expression/formation protein HypE